MEHALPRKLDYARVFVDVGVASLYFQLNGRSVRWLGKIGPERAETPRVLSDAEYFRHRLKHAVTEVRDEAPERVVVATADGMEEEWIKPRWILRRRRIRANAV